MSSLSNLPYGKILDYWFEKLKGRPYRFKFLITKTVEVFTFKSQSGRYNNKFQFVNFPKPLKNNILKNANISIVIPTYIKSEKDKKDIQNLLESINKQSLKPKKVIIVDDCSPIDFQFPKDIIVHRLSQNSGPAKARNIGKQIAIEKQTDIIAFTDTDCILAEKWIETISKSFIHHKNYQILSGNTTSYDRHWFGEYHNINGTLNGRKLKNIDQLLYGTTANLAITKEVASKIDFNENFSFAAGEDIDYCFRANKNGFAIMHISNMTICHNYGYNGSFLKNLKMFRHQFKKYGQGERILLKEIPEYYAYFDMTEEIETKKNGLQQCI